MTESSCLSMSQSMAFRESGRDSVTSTATAEASASRPSTPRRNSSTSTDGSDEGSFITTFTITPDGGDGLGAVNSSSDPTTDNVGTVDELWSARG